MPRSTYYFGFNLNLNCRPEFESKDVLKKDDKGILFLDKTSFYSESGGQVGDTGEIVTESGSIFVVRGNPVEDIMYLMFAWGK